MSSFPRWSRTSPFPLHELLSPEPSFPNLFLLGTLHHDPKGFGRLRRFLDRFEPELVCVEFSPYGWTFRKRFGRALRETLRENLQEAATRSGQSYHSASVHPQIISIRRQIGLPFEYLAARSHAAAHKARLILVDWSPFSRRCIETWPELLTVDNLFQLLQTPAVSPRRAYAYAEAASQIYAQLEPPAASPSRSPDPEDALWRDREEHMARLVRCMCLRYSGERILYVGGWWHLRADGPWPSLRTLLHVDASRCFLLDRLPEFLTA